MPKEERQIKEITDNDLDTGRDLVTENYELEILTLKDKVDLRRFSRSFLKIDKLLKSIFTGKEDKFSKNSGFNREKTDTVENDTNKVFSAKGAFDLKTYLVTNYTTLMNNIRDTLTDVINLKLPHGGYGGSGQQLKNEIDEAPQKIKWINIPSNSDLNDYKITGRYRIYDNGQALNSPTGHAFNLDVLSVGGAWITQMLTTYVGRIYVRFYNPGDKIWSVWGENYTDLTLPRSNSTTSDSENYVATSKAVKTLNDTKFDKVGGLINGSIDVTSTGTFFEIFIKKYTYIRDYYGEAFTAKVWYNKGNSFYPLNSLFFDDISDLYVGRSKVLNQRNSGFVREVLFNGTINKTTNAILTKSITEFDLVYLYIGDTEDMSPIIYQPDDMLTGIGSKGIFQAIYLDSNGGDASNNAMLDCAYMKMYSPTEIRFVYGYSNSTYSPDKISENIKIVGIKFNFGTK